ncbi:TPA: hypothetical protein ACKQAY_002489, partial [Stenotrophomonas maltophilia]
RPHPWGLDGAIHGANGPANPHLPAFDSFPVTVGKSRFPVGVDLGRRGRSTLCVDEISLFEVG